MVPSLLPGARLCLNTLSTIRSILTPSFPRLACLFLALNGLSFSPTSAAPPKQPTPPQRVVLQNTLGKLPLSFEPNRGQADPRSQFLSRGDGYRLALGSTEAVFAPSASRPPRSNDRRRTSAVRMKLIGANPNARSEGEDLLPGKTHYFRGRDPQRWRRNIPSYSKVRYRSVYPGIDLVYYGNRRQLEYDFIVAPGADPKRIRLDFAGMRRLSIDSRGDLLLRHAGGEMRFKKPVAYQVLSGIRTEVPARYERQGKGGIRFRVGKYDREIPLVIDPVLIYSTYLGGKEWEEAYRIAVDDRGYIYVTGRTESPDFPVIGREVVVTNTNSDLFVTKFNPSGNAVMFSTHLGGSSNDTANGIGVDAEGNVTLAGTTHSTDFPVASALSPEKTNDDYEQSFITKLGPNGDRLIYSTYFQGGAATFNGHTLIHDLAVDFQGNAYVTGYTSRPQFPTTPNAFQPNPPTGSNWAVIFLTKLNSAGNALLYSTYLMDSTRSSWHTHLGYAVHADDNGNAYVTGRSDTLDFPTTPNAYKRTDGSTGTYLFVTQFNTLASGDASLAYSTVIGSGSGTGIGTGITADSAGNIYVTGVTDAAGFPTTPNAYQRTYAGGGADAFVLKLNPALAGEAGLAYSSFLGGSRVENAYRRDTGLNHGIGPAGIAVDAGGHLYVTGVTSSKDFPVKEALQKIHGNTDDRNTSWDGFIARLNPSVSGAASLVWSTFLGGKGQDYAADVALDRYGTLHITGGTVSLNFPVANAPYNTFIGRGMEAFVTKIAGSTTGSGLPQLFTVTPHRGGNAGSVTFRIDGVSLPDGATVKLRAPDLPDLEGQNPAVSGGKTLLAAFDLEGAAPGLRDVVVSLPGGETLTLGGSFTVEAGGEPDVWVDVVGRTRVLGGRVTHYSFVFGNRGAVDASGTPIISGIPADSVWNVLTPSPTSRSGKPLDWTSLLRPATVDGKTSMAFPLITLPPNAPPFVIQIRMSIPLSVQEIRLKAEWKGSGMR